MTPHSDPTSTVYTAPVCALELSPAERLAAEVRARRTAEDRARAEARAARQAGYATIAHDADDDDKAALERADKLIAEQEKAQRLEGIRAAEARVAQLRWGRVCLEACV